METNELLDAINEVSKNYQPRLTDIVLTIPTRDEKEKALLRGGLTLGTGKDPSIAASEIIHTILAVGPQTTDLKVGDKVVLKALPKGQGYPVLRIKGKEYIQVNDFSVLGIVKGDIS